jgi:hypothetical protein
MFQLANSIRVSIETHYSGRVLKTIQQLKIAGGERNEKLLELSPSVTAGRRALCSRHPPSHHSTPYDENHSQCGERQSDERDYQRESSTYHKQGQARGN